VSKHFWHHPAFSSREEKSSGNVVMKNVTVAYTIHHVLMSTLTLLLHIPALKMSSQVVKETLHLWQLIEGQLKCVITMSFPFLSWEWVGWREGLNMLSIYTLELYLNGHW
jgi:hypothetical protein